MEKELFKRLKIRTKEKKNREYDDKEIRKLLEACRKKKAKVNS